MLIVSLQKGGQSSGAFGTWKNLLAFYLACLTLTLFLFGVGAFGLFLRNHHPVRVEIRSNVDVHDIVTAIQSVHRTDVEIRTKKDPISANWATTILGGALGFMMLTGLVIFIYKQICRWMGIEATV